MTVFPSITPSQWSPLIASGPVHSGSVSSDPVKGVNDPSSDPADTAPAAPVFPAPDQVTSTGLASGDVGGRPASLLGASSPFDVLTLPEQRGTPEGLLYTFRFSNGYGAFVLRPRPQQGTGQQSGGPAAGSQPTFEVCLLDCAGEERPTFALPLCPGVQGGLTAAQVSGLLLQAERLERHPRRSLQDRALLSETF